MKQVWNISEIIKIAKDNEKKVYSKYLDDEMIICVKVDKVVYYSYTN